MIGYVNRADTIQNVRGFNSGNKTQQDHRKTPFPKYCDEYTTKRPARQWDWREKLKPGQVACVIGVIIGIVLLGVSDGLAEV